MPTVDARTEEMKMRDQIEDLRRRVAELERRAEDQKNAALQAYGLLRRVRDQVDAVQFYEANAVMGMLEAGFGSDVPLQGGV
jgi:hypothetical protein